MSNFCAYRHLCILENICELLQPFWKISQTVIRSLRIPCGIPRPVSWCELVTRSEAGLDDVIVGVLDESCDGDVEDELDNPGTTIGTKFLRFAYNILPLFGQPWLFTADPLVSISVFIAELSK